MPLVPSSTYRLQIRAGFDLNDAAGVVDYLAELGAGAVYLSPILQATSGSDHGYDTTDPARIDEARGGAEGLQRLFEAAAERGLGVVIDIVPNHLGVAAAQENPYWWDVLARGRDSAYADWFDIDWTRGRITVPVLGEDQTLQVVDGELRYFDLRFPLAEGSWAPGDDPSAVHDRQHYELIDWTRGNSELNYRRFFAITSLAGVRVEDEHVFAGTHARIPEWIDRGLAGLRIDHPDGLADPAGYLRRLRSLGSEQWIVVEKILEPGEKLPDWPVAGTTGYDAMREVNAVFVDVDRAERFTDLYVELTGDTQDLDDHVAAGKRMVVEELLRAEVRRMVALTPGDPNTAAALAELAVAFPVYRSYVPDGLDHLDAALRTAADRRPDLAPTLERLGPRLRDPGDELAVRMQQLSGATMAKGVEDTAYYRYARFVALNEVGGDPAKFGLTVADFHAAQRERQVRQPTAMTSLATHDTKRGEDVRARLSVLAEIPEEWRRFAETFLGRTEIPSRPLAYFLAQTLVGAGRIALDRMHAYAEKSMREAADGTTWTAPNRDFEARVHAAVDAAYEHPELSAAWDEILGRVEQPGWSNALGQKLVQLTMPGVPDVYQGTELWDDSLVDPDNRRPVDFAARRALLAGLPAAPALDRSGVAKLWVTRQALRARREHPEWFRDYRPLAAVGPAAGHLLAFDRGGAVTLATRLPLGLTNIGGWGETALQLPRPSADRLSGRTFTGQVAVAELFSALPVSLLIPA